MRFPINGWLETVEDVDEYLRGGVYGVMVGRAVMHQLWHVVYDVDWAVYGEERVLTGRKVNRGYVEHAEKELEQYGRSVRGCRESVAKLVPRRTKWYRASSDDISVMGYICAME